MHTANFILRAPLVDVDHLHMNSFLRFFAAEICLFSTNLGCLIEESDREAVDAVPLLSVSALVFITREQDHDTVFTFGCESDRHSELVEHLSLMVRWAGNRCGILPELNSQLEQVNCDLLLHVRVQGLVPGMVSVARGRDHLARQDIGELLRKTLSEDHVLDVDVDLMKHEELLLGQRLLGAVERGQLLKKLRHERDGEAAGCLHVDECPGHLDQITIVHQFLFASRRENGVLEAEKVGEEELVLHVGT